ncbi:MAG: FTR1 family protein [Burkholderiaceae bacterium]
MFGSALIVFRETLEAALLIGIIAAATRGAAQRGRFIGLGMSAGLIGAILLALVVERFPDWVGDSGQDLFNAAVLGAAVLMLAWHNIWMARHATEMAMQARSVGQAVLRGERTLTAVALVVGLTVLREGAETVLFLVGLTSGGMTTVDAVAGGLIGVVGGAALGALIYAGLVRIPLRQLFNATGVLLLLLAAGMAGQAARFLIQSDHLPPLASPLWDTSSLVPSDSALGSALHVLIGYDARPSGMQVIFFAVALLVIAIGMRAVRPRSVRRASPATGSLPGEAA